MPARDLKLKYGRNLRTRGDACLSAMTHLHILCTKLQGLSEHAEAQRALDITREIANRMTADIMRRYSIGQGGD